MQSASESTNQPQAPQPIAGEGAVPRHWYALLWAAGDVTGAAAAAESHRRVILGNAKGNMNLAAVRARAEELRKSLEQVRVALEVNAQHIHWGDILNRYAVLNVQYHNLVDQLRPLLKHYVVFPKSVNQQNAQILPIMLASKALPEMEVEDAELLAAHEREMGGLRVEQQYEALGGEADHLNKVVDQLTAATPSGPGVLSPQHPLRAGLAQTQRALATSSGPSLKRAGSGARGGPLARKRRAEGTEILLAALSSGEGLRV